MIYTLVVEFGCFSLFWNSLVLLPAGIFKPWSHATAESTEHQEMSAVQTGHLRFAATIPTCEGPWQSPHHTALPPLRAAPSSQHGTLPCPGHQEGALWLPAPTARGSLLAALHAGSTALGATAIKYFCIVFPPRRPRQKLTIILLNPHKQFKDILKRRRGSTLTVLRLLQCLVFEDELQRSPERSPGSQQQCSMNDWQRAMPCNPRARFFLPPSENCHPSIGTGCEIHYQIHCNSCCNSSVYFPFLFKLTALLLFRLLSLLWAL